MDAITPSLSRIAQGHQLEPTSAWRLILTASLSNFLFKGIAATFLGGWRLGLRLAPFLAVVLLGGVLLIGIWPKSWAFATQ